MRAKNKWIILALVFTFLLAAAMPAATQDQPQSEQQKSEKDTKEKRKGSGFFEGLKAVSGSGSEQRELTATAGSKTVGEGEQIGNTQPTSADRAAVAGMESYSIPDGDLKKFQSNGHLMPAK